jgi:hypothetical protein
MSSENPILDNPSPSRLQISYNFAIYSRKRIGESGEPCGTPASIGNKAISCPWITRVVL